MSLAPTTLDCSAGFMTTVLPVTSAALVMPHRIASGKFQGAITMATPRGSWMNALSSPDKVTPRGRAPRLPADHQRVSPAELRLHLRESRLRGRPALVQAEVSQRLILEGTNGERRTGSREPRSKVTLRELAVLGSRFSVLGSRFS